MDFAGASLGRGPVPPLGRHSQGPSGGQDAYAALAAAEVQSCDTASGHVDSVSSAERHLQFETQSLFFFFLEISKNHSKLKNTALCKRAPSLTFPGEKEKILADGEPMLARAEGFGTVQASVGGTN